MGIQMDWGKILSTLVAEIVKIFLPKAKDLLEWALDKAYELAEEWAKKFDKDEKPTGAQKMAMAVGVVTSLAPEVEPAAARMLLEAKHLQTTGKATA